MNKTALFLIALGTALAVASRADEHKPYKVDASKLPPASGKTGLTYEKDIKPMVEKSCLKCHSGDRPKAKLLMDTLPNLLKGGENGKAIIPGKSAESPAVGFSSDLVAEMEMPPMDKRDRYPALTKEQIGLLRAWIDQGAK